MCENYCEICGKPILQYRSKLYCSKQCAKTGKKQKTQKTNLERYGCKNVFQNERIKEKSKVTLMKNYGVKNPSQSQNIKAKRGYSPYNYMHWVEKGFSEEEAKYQVKIRRPLNMQYWLNLGLNQQEAKQKLHQMHSNGLEKSIKLHGEIQGRLKQKKRIKKIKEGSKRCVQYWQLLGYSLQQSKSKVSQEQKRDLDYFIGIYGQQQGRKRHNLKIQKWIRTMELKDNEEKAIINEKKNVSDYYYLIEKYTPQEAILKMVQTYKVENRQNMQELLSCNTLQQLIDKIPKLLPLKEVTPVLNHSYIQKKFKITQKNLTDVLTEVYNRYGVNWFKRKQYGQEIEYQGIIFKSKSQFQIAKYLSKHSIEYVYQKPYIGSHRKKTDFYLPKYNCYIEYTGMMDMYDYTQNINKKKKLALQNGMNVFFSSSVSKIKEYIRRLNEKESNH